jgi:hypothetical protein
MKPMKLTIAAFATTAVLAWPLAATAGAVSVADQQGFCKKQGPSSCAGGSECSGGHIDALPAGQQKKC